MARLDIEIETRKMLKPSAPTPDNLRKLKLSLFDQLAPRAYVTMLLNYLPSSSDHETISYDKLEKSLAQTLIKFYPFAGRFGKDDPLISIDCNDEGVEYVQTKVNADDLPEFLHLNVFNNGGIAIGVKISHIIADAFTIATFVNEWAHTCLTGTITQDTNHYLPSFGQLSSLFPARMLQLPSPPNTSTTGPEIVTRRFVFDALAIENIRKTIKKDSTSDDMIKQPSRVAVVMSVIWKVLAHFFRQNGNSRDSSLTFSINLRENWNFVMTAIANMEADEARKDELNDFVKLVGNTIRDTCVAIGKASSVDDISSLTVNNLTKMDLYGSTSWCKLPWYEADFGWGKPFWVSPVGFYAIEGAILMDTKDGNGIHVTFYPLAGRFREDELSFHCNDEGVEYIETNVNTDLAELGGPSKINIEVLDDLLPKMEHRHTSKIQLKIQLPSGLLEGKSNMEARKDELNDFVKLVGNTIGYTCVAIGKAESVDDISSLIVNNQRKVIENLPKETRLMFIRALVGADFAGISLMDTKDGDGIEAWVSLMENGMAQFERDPNILSSTSKLAFNSFG
ncbi:hypothetical protein H5410_064289 [Solanum commersonii]|uniref:Uncharacterized protein n=1 Tax=Solanum commersonii TaxID=4109 RepID=A0A9J5VZX2_SOLCO|nr:hypothetical protein H5410_064289 [Solanum commersonii]